MINLRRRHALFASLFFLFAILLLRQTQCDHLLGLCSNTRPDETDHSSFTVPEQPQDSTAVNAGGEHEDIYDSQDGSLFHGATPPQAPDSTGHIPYVQLQERIQRFIKSWNRPSKDEKPRHSPPYQDYVDRDYDPNRWEVFEWNNEFYTSNGISQIKSHDMGPEPYLPYPPYNSAVWKREWLGEYAACIGPRGKLLNESEEDIVKAYPLPHGAFPAVVGGDANETGINLSHCFDRFHRYGPYGFGLDSEDAVIDWDPPENKPNWTTVKWDQLQNQCLLKNQERYHTTARYPPNPRPSRAHEAPDEPLHTNAVTTDPRSHHRTAILIRTWTGYKYRENDLQAIRALITETSLLSGGEYHVFLFVNVKDNRADFFGDLKTHERILKKHVPEEFWGISILWSENLMEEWYPKVGDWQVYWSQFMPLQWFAKTYPEFDLVWNWETDVRYTGNHYEFLEGVSGFAERFPRKYAWERNQRYYFPAVHGSYKQWLDATDRDIERGMRERKISPIWGPNPYNTTRQQPVGPTPPTNMENDDFSWGVGEEADLITLLPIFDPRQTKWDYRNKIWEFIPGVRPHFTPEDGGDIHFFHEEFVNIPRRVYINTVSRFSKRLLHAMHLENLAGRNMQAEMWPATVALHHGLKAVYAPHPIWTDRKWPGWYTDAIFNADGGKAAQWSQAEDSVYAHDREHNFEGWSWYYNGMFARSLYRRWLGWASRDTSPLNDVGGRTFENEGVTIHAPVAGTDASTGSHAHIGGHGRICLPGMLLHPVKNAFEDAEKPLDNR